VKSIQRCTDLYANQKGFSKTIEDLLNIPNEMNISMIWISSLDGANRPFHCSFRSNEAILDDG